MSRQFWLGSSEGASAAWALGVGLSDAEFRVLMILSECPNGEEFSCRMSFFEKKGMRAQDVEAAVESLAQKRALIAGDGDTIFRVDGDVVRWRFIR